MEPSSDHKQIVLVIAAYDEAANIEELCARLFRVFDNIANATFEFVWVVEGTDDTIHVLRSISPSNTGPDFKIIEPDQHLGLGAAVRLGFAALPEAADIVITMDADLSHQPEDIPRLLEALETQKADVAVGSRRIPGGKISGLPPWRALLSRVASWGLCRLFRTDIRDVTSGFRVYRAGVLQQLHFDSDGYAFLPEMLGLALRARMRIVEAPIHYKYRRQGETKLRIGQTCESYLRFIGTYLGLR